MSGENGTSSDQVIAKLIEMGFEDSDVIDAVKVVGASLDNAIEYILNGSNRNCMGTSSSSSNCSTNNGKTTTLGKRHLSSSSVSKGLARQSSLLDHFQSTTKPKRSKSDPVLNGLVYGSAVLPSIVEEKNERGLLPACCPQEVDIGSDWELKVKALLQKHFGFSSLKNFQKEALSAWIANQDCLVLAATGSGKSLCFQIPALLTGKVVVVLSPLISLMHDQCSKLSKHGVSACFLGSGQPDSSVEQKALRGMYNIIYVCPETVLRLIEPLQRLAETRGIALFAIDEVHCVSKWGHDFRPDYRRLSALRENFSAKKLKFLKFDIPLMALTATATIQVREDILKSLRMPKETKIVLTSFFRSNLRFSVKHSRTSSPASYEKDFRQLIDIYIKKIKTGEKKKSIVSPELDEESEGSASSSMSDTEDGDIDGDDDDDDDDAINSRKDNVSNASRAKEMSIEYLENDVDVFQSVDDWDVACGEFSGQSPPHARDLWGSSVTTDPPSKPEERLGLLKEPLGQGPTIIYVPTRKQTLSIAKFLCQFGVKAAAYNASLPKTHLRRVHQEFHENKLEVVVATIAFGMGIDKSNVRRIIHYGWPQSLEAYYQEAGRAGRDGKLADCVLYANLSRAPTLLPNKRSEEQTEKAYKMLSDCYRYGMNTSSCRAKMLVEYFGEDFIYDKCLVCDVCVNGPPEMKNLQEEANILMQVIAAAHRVRSDFLDGSYDDVLWSDIKQQKIMEKPNLKTLVSKIREQSTKYLETDMLWWRGLARIMENKGYIKEADEKIHVLVKFPEPTKLGLRFLESDGEQTFNIYPEADMLLASSRNKPFSSFSEWGKGWADPEIRRQRLGERRFKRKSRKSGKTKGGRKSRKSNPDSSTVRGRLAAKLSRK